ncbi:EMSY protein [Perkinsela sp. CCAP 1560/4]|nr:EMSY protein [Perkinsela sp. CCAP 1560/4]|eukprot:KNH06396.1 EMSY protein [Perkinsela sp. CCAP 1560/4]
MNTTESETTSLSTSHALLHKLDNRLTSSSTISTPIIKLTDIELYEHLRNEESLTYIHALRALKCYNNLDRKRERLLEDIQDVLCIPENLVLLENARAENDSIIGLIRKHTIAERRGVLEEYDQEVNTSVEEATPCDKISSHGSSRGNNLKDYELYCLMRQEELLSYHHLEKSLACVSNPKKEHARLVEDVAYIFHIPVERAKLEQEMAIGDPVLLLIRANNIARKRKLFDGRNLDDSYTPSVSSTKERFIEEALSESSAIDDDQVSASEGHEKSIDRMYRDVLFKRDACANLEITSDEWRKFLESSLEKLASIRSEITRQKEQAAINQ